MQLVVMMRFLKVLAGFVGLLAVVGALILAIATRNTPATHPALADADLPPLFSVREMRTNLGSSWGYKISHGAKYLSHWTVRGTQSALVVRDAVSKKELLSLTDVRFDYWNPAQPRLRAYIDRRLWEIDPEHPDRNDWVDVTPRGLDQWNISSVPTTPKDRLLVVSADRDPAAADVFVVNQDGSNKTLVEQNQGRTTNWLFDADLTPQYRMDLGDNDEQIILRRDGQDWVESFRLTDSFEKLFWLEVTQDTTGFLAFSSRGRDKLALVQVDGHTGEETVVFEDPGVDVNQAVNYHSYDGKIDAVILQKEGHERVAFTPRGRAFVDLVDGLGSQVDVAELSVAEAGRYVTIAASVAEQSWNYYLLDLDNVTATHLGAFGLHRHAGNFTQTKAVTIPARDGVDLPGYLSLPIGAKGPFPFVMRVHGGPAHRDVWGYDHERQFLNNRGYAVLNVNFRGSTGYGKAFQQLGYGEYGAAMQDDLVDAANWAIAQGVADKHNMVIAGGSYGGYAAALAMTRDPGLFKAAIVEAAVLDVPYQMRNNPFGWRLSKHELVKYFGDINDQEDLATMGQRSPQTHVDALAGPILLIAGKRDRVVGFEQSEAFERAALDAGKDVRAYYFERAGHRITRWQDMVTYSRVVEDFLAEQIGGRSGGWDPIELAADYID